MDKKAPSENDEITIKIRTLDKEVLIKINKSLPVSSLKQKIFEVRKIYF